MATIARNELAAAPPIGKACRDYNRVQDAVRFMRQSAGESLRLEALADHLGMSPTQCQKLFKRWCGLTPKEFASAITLDRARALLAANHSVLDAAHGVGLSGGGRLHDLFVTHEAMTPGEFKRRGADLDLAWGAHATPFGEAVAVMSSRGLCGLAFVDAEGGRDRAATIRDLAARWPAARLAEDPAKTTQTVARIFCPSRWAGGEPIRLVMIGTDWEVRVWQSLLEVPLGGATSYRDVARKVCSGSAARAVGRAVGRNPLSFVVPCHRVLRSDGHLGGYHWGVTRKLALIGWEAGQT